MAVKATMNDLVLQVRLENGESSTGKTTIKKVNFTNVKLNATDQQLFDMGSAVAGLLEAPLSGLRKVTTDDLTDEG